MNKSIIHLIILLLLCSISGTEAIADSSLWSKYNSDGEAAYKRGDLTQAERLFNAALTEAKKPGEQGEHLAFSLHRLAELYRAQGRQSEAEPLFKCSSLLLQQIRERALLHKATHAQQAKVGQNTPSSNQTESAKSGTQTIGRGGWDGNDLRINRHIQY